MSYYKPASLLFRCTRNGKSQARSRRRALFSMSVDVYGQECTRPRLLYKTAFENHLCVCLKQLCCVLTPFLLLSQLLGGSAHSGPFVVRSCKVNYCKNLFRYLCSPQRSRPTLGNRGPEIPHSRGPSTSGFHGFPFQSVLGSPAPSTREGVRFQLVHIPVYKQPGQVVVQEGISAKKNVAQHGMRICDGISRKENINNIK